MLRLPSVIIALVATLLVLMLILVGCAKPAPAAAPKITLNPSTVNSSITEMTISGSGFTPNSIVSGGIPELQTQRNTVVATQGVWFLIAQANDQGAFEVKVRLANGLWNLIVTKMYTEDELVGTRIVTAEDEKGLKAEASLTIEKAPPKK